MREFHRIFFRAKPATYSGNGQKVAGLRQNARQVYAGIGGRFKTERPAGLGRISHIQLIVIFSEYKT